MKFDSMRNALAVAICVTFLAVFSSIFGSCKKDGSPQTHLVVQTYDSAGVKPLQNTKVVVFVDTTYKVQSKQVSGFPKVLYSDSNGNVTFDFDNGIVVYIDAYYSNGSSRMLSEKSFAALDPGTTFTRKMFLKVISNAD